MIRLTLLLIACFTLGGCILTRVSDNTHAKEVDGLHAVGLSLDAAKQRAIQAGYDCEPNPDPDVSVQTESGVHKMMVLQCNKTSLELVCPQRRYVVFNANPQSKIVLLVGKRITQQSCF